VTGYRLDSRKARFSPLHIVQTGSEPT
jgi:hypothetical protein